MKAGFVSLALLWAVASPLDAQIISGQLVDETTESGVATASVVLLDQRGIPNGPRVISSAEGRFQIRLEGPGVYRLEIQRLGYEQLTTLPFEVRPEDELITVKVVLIPRIIELDPITLEVRRREPLSISVNALDQFRYRAETGFGSYITKEEIGTKYPSMSFESLIRTVPWARFDRVGTRTIAYVQQAASACGVKWWLDGFAVHEPADDSDEVGRSGLPLSIGRYSFEIPAQLKDLDPQDVEGMEAYRGPAQTPAEFLWTSAEPYCAAIVVWTSRSRLPGDRGGSGGGD
jgi:hypothetical protein